MIINNLYNKDEEITIESYLLKNDIKDISEFINPTGKYIDNYSSYNNMDKAVKELKKHYENNEDKIFIIQDPDVDGIVSASILYQYLKALKDWDISILMHTGKQRGISDVDIFKKIKEEKPNLVIVPDAGSNDKEQIDELYDLGISYIALDHHIISTPSDYGILVNNQDENSKVSKKGSGGLVAHKFLEALDNEFNKEWSSWFIDMVALSLLSDSMDMSDQQNRTYYHYGLETMGCVNNIFLKECIKTFINKDTYSQRSFIGEYDISDMLVLCEEAHKKQQKTVASIIDNNIDTIKKANKNNIVVFYSDDIPSSYSGLVGGKMMSICDNKPCIAGSIEDGYFLGSLRSPISLGEELDNNEFVEWARGHEKACGIKIKEENIDKLVEYYNNVTLDYTPQDGYGHFAYTKGSAGWTGGGLVRAGANVPGGESIPSFNMAGTKKMTFDIRGNINPQTLVLAIQNRTQIGASDVVPSKTPIKTLGNVSSLSETDWKSVTIDFSSSTADDIINAFCIIIAGDWGGTTTDSWFDIKNLDWIDSTGKSVTLSIKN